MKWILGTVILLLVGLIFQLGLLIYAMYLLMGILILTRTLSSIWIRGLQTTRSISPKETEIGEVIRVSVQLKNKHSFSIPWVIMEEEGPVEDLTGTPPKLSIKGPRLALDRMKPAGRHWFTYEATAKTRGYFPFGPVQVETGDVFGLHRRQRTLGKRDGVLVLPKILPIERNQWASNRALGETPLTHRLFEDPARFSGIRPYQAGDPLNRIHWRATARTGELQTRIFDPTCIQGATMVVDFHESSFNQGNASAEAELLITTTASLAHAFQEEGEQIGLLALAGNKAERIRDEDITALKRINRPWFGSSKTETKKREQTMLVATRKGGGQLQVIKEALAKMEFATQSTFDAWITHYQHCLPRDASVIVLCRDLSVHNLQGILSLKTSGYRTSVILVNWQNESQPDWAAPTPERAELAATSIPCFHVSKEEDIAWLGCDRQTERHP